MPEGISSRSTFEPRAPKKDREWSYLVNELMAARADNAS